MQRKIVADSSANLTERELPLFSAVALKIITAEKEYIDDPQLDVAAMQRELEAYPRRSGSACPPVSEWLDAFGDADEVFGVTLTGALSGCYNAGRIAAADYMAAHPGRRVFLLDSRSTGPEMELLAEKLAELCATERDFESICCEITAYAARTRLLFSLTSLSNFAKNGRVSPVLAKATGLLGIRIVGRASDGGELEPLHRCRGEKAALSQLLRSMQESGFSGGRVRIRHSFNTNAAESLAALLRAQYPACDIRIGVNRGLCSYYAEKGGLLVGFEV